MTITMRKYCPQQSHDVAQKYLPKLNSEAKDAEVIRRIEKQVAN